jgi:hypothetical protein
MRLGTAWMLWCCCAVWLAASSTATAQSPGGLSQRLRKAYSLPDGFIQSGDRNRVSVRDEKGTVVAALIHVRIGDEYLLQMPDGRMVKARVEDVRPTNAPFVPASRERMKLDLKRELGPAYKLAESKNYLFFYTCSDAYQQTAANTLEAVHAGIYKYFEEKYFAVRKPDVPLVAIIFKNRSELQRYSQKAAAVNGYYDQITNHIVFYEESELMSSVGEEIARDQMLGVVAHEGVHQTLCNIGVQPRLVIWPIWVMEGLAEYFAPTVDGKTTEWKGVGQVNDTRMGALEGFFKSPAKNRGYLKRLFSVDELDPDGYAFSWAMVHYLSKEKPASLMQYLRSLNARTPLEAPAPPSGRGTFADAELEIFDRYFAMSPGELEIELAYHLRKLPFEHPLQNAKHYVGIIEYIDGPHTKRAAYMCLAEAKAATWRDSIFEKLTPEQRSRARSFIKELENRDSAKQYAYRWLNPQER